MKPNPVVSVFTLCYNNSENVMKALTSIKNQTYSEIDHIILDDGSSNGSAKELQTWIQLNNYKCRFIQNNKNIGICKSLNKMIRIAYGEFMAINCDDYWVPFHLEKSLEILKNSGADAMYSGVKIYKPNGEFIQTLEDSLLQINYPRFNNLFCGKDDYFILPKEISVDALFYTNYLHILSLIIPIELIISMGGFDENLPFEDYDMNFKICRNLKVCYNKSFDVIYFKHETSYTMQPSQCINLLWGIVATLMSHIKLVHFPDTKKFLDNRIHQYSLEILKKRPKYFAKIIRVFNKIFPGKRLFNFIFLTKELLNDKRYKFLHLWKRYAKGVNRRLNICATK